MSFSVSERGAVLRSLCFTAILVYADRGVMSSAAVSGTPRGTNGADGGSGMQGALGCSYAEYGALTAAFMCGLLVGSPMFASAANDYSGYRLIAIGLGAYAIGEFGCATARTYGTMFAFRCLVGLGEASFVALAAPFIDDHAPVGRKTVWLAMFYACVPMGVASGIALGGGIASTLGWRWAFGLNALTAVPAAAYFGLAPVTSSFRGGVEDGANENDVVTARHTFGSKSRELATDLRELFSRDVYVCTVLAYAAYTAVIGVYAVWGPKAGYAIFKDYLHTSTRADMILGGVTVVSGIAGTLLGGWYVDAHGSSMTTALRTSAIAALAGFMFLEIAFACKSFVAFIAMLMMGQTFAFALQAPVNVVILRSVSPRLRPLACSMTTVVIHVLGDVPTPPVFGHVLEMNGDPTPERWRDVCAAFTLLFIAAASGMHSASLLAARAVDRSRIAGADDADETTTEVVTADDSHVHDRLL